MARDFCDIENELSHCWVSLGKKAGKGLSCELESFNIGNRFHVCNRGDPTEELDFSEECRGFAFIDDRGRVGSSE